MESKSFLFSSLRWLKPVEIHLLNAVFCIDEIRVSLSQHCSVYEDDTFEESCTEESP